MRRLFGPGFDVKDEYFTAWDNRLILDRALRNLKGVYLSRGDLEQALTTVDLILAVAPEQENEIRDRGLLSARLGRYGAAYADLETYLRLVPEAPDAEQVQKELSRVRKKLESVN